jgi:hypothetical protein
MVKSICFSLAAITGDAFIAAMATPTTIDLIAIIDVLLAG